MKRRNWDLPEGVMFEILSWLPAKCIIRFKCVCKSWYELINALIRNPPFITKQLHNINKELSSLTSMVFICNIRPFNLRSRWYGRITLFSCFDDDDENEHIHYHICKKFSSPFSRNLIIDSVLYHCDGILCIGGKSSVSLWNPAIDEFRTLPKPSVVEHKVYIVGQGFGYDSKANDYKVVRFGMYNENFEQILEVYSMATDSWREIKTDVPLRKFLFLNGYVYCKGVCYWSSSFVAGESSMILSFDMCDEVFHVVPLPNNRAQDEECFKVTLWNESVALLFYPMKSYISSIEIWVLSDCVGCAKGSTSWTKHVRIGPLLAGNIASVWTFSKSGELLMLATSREVVSYNLYNQKLTKLKFVSKREIEDWGFCYVESLVSVYPKSELKDKKKKPNHQDFLANECS